MFTNHAAALAALAIASQSPAPAGYAWSIRKIPGMQMRFVGQRWLAGGNW